MSDSDLMTTREVAKMLNRSPSTIRMWLRDGQVPEYARPKKLHPKQRGGYWLRSAVSRWLREAIEGGK